MKHIVGARLIPSNFAGPGTRLAARALALVMIVAGLSGAPPAGAGSEPPADPEAYAAWKLSLSGIDATAPEVQSTTPAAPTGGGLLIPFESGGWTPFPSNDDGSTDALPLGFNFAFYGTTWPSVFVNNNGNITFGEPFRTFSPSGFPSTTFSMIAPFWADADTRCEGCGLVYYKFETARDQSWRRFVAHWDDVGRFDMQPGLGNTFQVVISNGNDPLLGSGNNVCLSYGDMQWTTGDASRGMDGFGGDPATVGANRGDGVTFFQYGRFDHEGMDYDGPGGLADGVSFLDGQTICFNTAQGLNVPPVVTGLPDNNTYDVRVGETLDASLSFLSGELNQVTTVTVDPGGLGNFTSMSVPGNPATVQFLFSPTFSQVGDNFVFVAATDDGGPPQTTNLALNFRVQSDCGNGELNPGEACDDGNSTPGDGCRTDCTEELCGDGTLDPQEECDDGNNAPGDGCRTDCTLEVCGDGTVDTGEGCDDGNNDDGDGCDAECNIEPSCGDGQIDGPDETCDPPGSGSGAPDECRDDCTFCGDGNLDTVMEPGEFVVDGGLDSWSGGRPAGWTVERSGGTVMEELDSFSGRAALRLVRESGGVLRVWQDVGGPLPGREHSLSFRFKTRGGVTGNNPLVQIRNMRTMEWLHADGSWGLTQGDALRGGVSADDVWERFQVAFAVPDHHLGTDVFRVALWHGGSGLAPIDHFYDAVSLKRAAVAGPGTEQCDDGNNESGDGCRADCTVEICGDGIQDSGEECDDGNGDVGDGCRPDCSAEACGDGIEDPAEECDDGNAGLGDGCRPDCTAERCGDGIEDPGEECDDGNTDDGDGCDAACALEGTETCGDGRLNQPGETCEPPGSNAGLPNECRGDCTFCGDGIRDVDVVDLIQDGGLESWAPETPGGWTTEPSAGEVMRNQAEAFVGDSCAQLVRHTDGVLRIWQDIDGFLPGRTYELRLRFKVRGGVNGNNPLVQIRNMHTMDWLHANGTWQSGLGDALRGGATLEDAWESFAVRFVTPITQDPADRLRLALWHGNAALVGVDHFYDAVAVIGPLGPGSEECDDGNNDSGDGCRADCTFEECGDGILDPGEACDDGFDNNDETPDACRSDCVLPSCGDGVRDSGEECDDSNNVDGDGCSATCGMSRCGDGDLDPGEQCDDGNRDPGDGCRANCTVEACGDAILDPGEACDDGLDNSDDLADSCRTNCSLPSCGDGTVDSGESCDDGNNEPGDGCRADCTLEECGDSILDPGEDCDDGNNEPGDGCRADCTVEECGDTVLDPGEDCDDGNNEPGDGCRADCTLEECGDAILDPGEDCDDGNSEPGDGCRADCTVEECGDAILDPGEDCDDGNNEPGDGCRADCTLEECGDSILDSGEGCDDGNNEPGDGCRADCTVEECGDTVLDPGEDCDDGNNEPGDGCRADCTLEECGDAILDPGEDCDDGNNEPGDGCRADCTLEECGDAILDPGEDCDDGNNEPGDGCRADCTVEECGDAILDPGEDCDDGNNEPGDGCRADCTVEECGDGILDSGEGCDDGNNEPGDGCRADCTLEECGDAILDPGEDCDDGNNEPGDGCRADCTLEECGDSILDPGEDCDDGNNEPGDGCRANCTVEACGDAIQDPGEACDDGLDNSDDLADSCRTNCSLPSCGDGTVDSGESCDDGNNEPGDGCRADCTVEECGDTLLDPGEDCDDGNNEPGDGCRADCTVEECGDTLLDPGEDCDDGNNEPGDGCRADCTVEECGDTLLDPGEDCDDGNNEPGDGCRADCTLEECGDALLDPGEDCDDGNNEPGDGCRADCTVEECGDTVLDPGEDCDDGNNEPGDGCRPDCTVEECGDAILDPGEDCDDGNNEPGDGCRADCTLEECGDTILDAGEDCDDGNNDSGDGCRADCTLEECGDGILDPDEDCDDGNDIDGDGCAADCRIEEPCELEVVKTCFVEPPVNDGDDDDDDDDDDCKGSVLAMRLQYTGLGCAATTNSQNGLVTCSGDAAGAGGVRVRVTDRRDDLTYADHEAVYLGDIIQATTIDGGGLMPQTTISIGDGVEEVSLDTSCTQPLSVGDRFGSTRLVGLTTTLGGTVTLPGVGESGETSECVVEPPPPAPHCQRSLETLTLRYLGGDCAETTNDQRGKVRCWGTSPIDTAVRVRCEGSGAVFADSGRPATLLPGGTIQATAAYAGRMKLPPRLDCSIEDEFGNWRQTVSIKTSCSESLDLGDVFGGLQAYGVESTGGGPVSMGRAVVYTYRITNKSAVPVFDVTALDSKLGEVPGSPVASIEPDQTVALQARTMISETTTNVVTVTGSTDGDQECPVATDSATVTFAGEDTGECASGLSAMLLRYTGPALEEAVIVQVRAGDFRNDPVVFTFPDGLQSGTVLSLASENGFSIDAVAHGESKLGDSTMIVINGVAETLDSSCATPLVPESAAALESSALTSSTSWEIVEFVD